MLDVFASNAMRATPASQVHLLLDNARQHTHGQAVFTRVNQASTHAWQLVDHPPCSPDLNPIEICWDQLKERLDGAVAFNPSHGLSEVLHRCTKRICISRNLDS